jgi:hypothetical protein
VPVGEIWGSDMTAGQTRIVLGDEYDDKLRKALLDRLREFGAQPVDRWHGVGGSQEVEAFPEWRIGGRASRFFFDAPMASNSVPGRSFVGLVVKDS